MCVCVFHVAVILLEGRAHAYLGGHGCVALVEFPSHNAGLVVLVAPHEGVGGGVVLVDGDCVLAAARLVQVAGAFEVASAGPDSGRVVGGKPAEALD